MKKIFGFLMAAAVLFGAASCAKEDISSSLANGEQVEVTFTANLPELGTRAYGEGDYANKLFYNVYEHGSDTPLTALCGTETSSTGKFYVTIPMIKGMKYDIVFWAQNADCGYYSLVGKEVTVDYTDVNANDDTRDAFFAYVDEFDPVTPAGKDQVKLYRPFAQLNAATDDLEAVKNSGVNLSTLKSTVSVKTYTTLNIATGEVDGETTVTFDAATIPAKLDTTEVLKASYDYLSMNYILVNVKELVEATLTVYGTRTDGGSEFPLTVNEYTNVPLQRNYRTNILGSLITKSTEFEVEILPGFTEPDQEPEALFLAAVLGGEVTLTEDVVLTQPLKVESKMTLDLNGHNITTTEQNAGRHHYAINNYGELTLVGEGAINARGIQNFGTMVVDGDLTITNIDTNGGAAIWNEGKITINKGTFATNNTAGEGSYGAALNTRAGGEAVVNGGNYYAYSQLTYAIINEGTTTINNAVVKAKHGAVAGSSSATTSIYGGSFELLDNPGISDHCTYSVSAIYGGKFTLNTNTDSGAQVFYESTIAAGYKAIEIGNHYYVLPEVVADAADVANVTAVTESTADVATALATDNGEATMFMWNDVAYIAKYGEVVITSSADEATTSRAIVESATTLTRATVAEGVEVVGNRTFRKCSQLETVAFPNTLTEIGPAVFQSCSKLNNVTIPASVTTIGEGAFAECVALTSINIPDGITRLEKDVLRNTGLVSIEIPASVNYIGTYAFRDCESLTEVKILSPEFTIEKDSFTNTAAPVPTMTIYVVNAEMKAYLDSTLTNYDKSYITVVVM